MLKKIISKNTVYIINFVLVILVICSFLYFEKHYNGPYFITNASVIVIHLLTIINIVISIFVNINIKDKIKRINLFEYFIFIVFWMSFLTSIVFSLIDHIGNCNSIACINFNMATYLYMLMIFSTYYLILPIVLILMLINYIRYRRKLRK